MLAPAGGPVTRHAIAPALASALLASALLAGGAHAQTVNPWDGPAAPRVAGRKAEGQAIIGHLAEGSWYVEVSHPEAMLFTAYVETRTGKAAKSTFAAQVSTGSSWAPLKVEFFKPKSIPAAAPAVPAPAVASAGTATPAASATTAPVAP